MALIAASIRYIGARTMRSSWWSSSLMSVVPNHAASEEPALLTSRSTGRAVSVSALTASRSPSSVVRSAVMTSTSMRYFSRRPAATVSSRSVSRATITRSWPRAASSRANALPMPAVAPVIRARPRMAIKVPCPAGMPGHGRQRYGAVVTTTIAVVNQKGGVGKTTTVASIGAALVEKGQRVLLVDLDPQGGLTFSLGIDPEDVDITIGDVLLGTKRADDAIVITEDGMHLLPSNITVAQDRSEERRVGKEWRSRWSPDQ